MNTLLLESASRSQPELDPGRRRTLGALVLRLAAWLPAEEEILQRERAANRPDLRRERRWRELLGLYERLCTALAAPALR